MAVDTKHPSFVKFSGNWEQMWDAYHGEDRVKEQREKYLPSTSGMKEDGMVPGQPGRAAYDAYLTRAAFPELIRPAVEAMIGVMHHKPPVIELPSALESMRERATLRNESLVMLLRRINEHQLITGRLGLLGDLDVDENGATRPYIAFYPANTILNWDDGRRQEEGRQQLNLVVLDESEYIRRPNFEWEYENRYRVLVLGAVEENGGGVYQVAALTGQSANFNPSLLKIPSLRGTTLEEIPFVFVNAKDVVPEPDVPPLLGLAKLGFTIYRTEADYRQALFMQGQDTLVTIGSLDPEKAWRTGASASINLPTGGDAKFIGVDSAGLSELRQALENDRATAAQKGGQLLDSVSRERESGDALKIRVAARTATLNQVALSGAFGLQALLRTLAVWVGADPEEAVVTPNLDFADDELEGKTLVEYATAKSLGVPISWRSIHKLMQERDITDLEYEDELAEIAQEEPTEPGTTDDSGPVDDNTPLQE